MRTDVLLTQEGIEAGFVEHLLHTRVDTRENHLDALTLRHETEVGEVVDARRIDKGHLSHADDTHLRTLMAQGTHDLLEFITGTEEVRTVDLIDLHTLGNREVFQVAHEEVALLFVGIDLVADDTHVGGLSHTAHEEQTGADETDLDGDGKVEDDREQEGDPEDDDIALRVLQDAQERTPATHVIAHDDKHTSQTGHGDILCQRHEEEEDEQQHGGVDDTRNRRATAIVDVGHRTGDGTGGRDTAEERTGQIGHTLGDEFGIRVVTVADDTISHGGREQRLNGTEDGNGDGGRHEALDNVPCELRHLSTRQLVGDGEAVADGFDAGDAPLMLQQEHSECHHNDGDQTTREFTRRTAAGDLRPEGDDRHTEHAHACTPTIDGGEGGEVGYPLLDEVGRHRYHRQAEEILDLRGEDGEGDTRRESHDDGIWDVLDDGTQMEHAEHDEEHTRHQCGNGQSFEAVLLDDTIYDNNKRARWSTDLHLRSTEDGNNETCHDGSDDTFLRCHARRDTEGDGQRQGHDTHDDTCQQVGHELLTVVMLQRGKQFWFKR